MSNRSLYNQILTEHNAAPLYKRKLADANVSKDGVNPTCGDEVTLELLVKGDTIVDGAFHGYGCAISQASVDIMLDMIIGKTKEEANALADLFFKMIQGQASEEDLEILQEAGALQDIARMPARVKCAVLGWHTMKEALQTDT